VEQVGEEDGIIDRHQLLCERRRDRCSRRLRVACGTEAEKVAHECADRVAPSAGAEVEHQPDVACKAGLPGRMLELLDQAGLADASFAPDVNGLSRACPEARRQRRVELLKFGLAADERRSGGCPAHVRAAYLPDPNLFLEAPHDELASLGRIEPVAHSIPNVL
jgi:hypothetical protein